MPVVQLNERDALLRKAAVKPGLISFAGGLPDPKLFPARALGAALQRALRDDSDQALQYGWPEGCAELRDYVAAKLRARGANVKADAVVITSGAQQAISLALAALERRGAVAVDDASYPGALDIFRAAQRRTCPLDAAARAYYVMPSVSNPRGQRMDRAERDALLARAKQQRAFIIEDDAYDGTWFTGELSTPLLAEAPQRVFHIGTFSKTLCPGLRIGWLVPPAALARRVLERKQARDLQANGLAQALLVKYLKGKQFELHRRSTVKRNRRKAELLMRQVAAQLPTLQFQPPGGGFSLWLEGNARIDQKRLLARAIAHGVSFDPGSAFRSQPRAPFAVRLCFSSVPERDIAEGVARLAAVIDAAQRRSR